MKNIGVFTSGGDAPGMNACIRAVVRTAVKNNLVVTGICRGYDGMISGTFKDLDGKSVSNIIQRGGTILQAGRSKDFMTAEGRKKAADNIKKAGIDGIIAIGGDGTFTGAGVFFKEYAVPYIGVPGTIDNDLFGTDFTIGYDTAINTTLEAIDKIKDTAASHNRIFLVEVMGRDSGRIALWSGIAGGAENILLPETPTDIDGMVQQLSNRRKEGRASSIFVVAEGDEEGGALEIRQKIKERTSDYEIKVTILGHIQRGGSPSCFDRVLASRLGVAAVEALIDGKSALMVGISGNKLKFTAMEKVNKGHYNLDPDLIRLDNILS